MAVDIRVTGADELDQLARRLRAYGERGKGLRKELMAAIREESKATVLAVKANTSTLPQRGGLARKLRTGVGVRTRAGGRDVGVRIVARNRYAVGAINAGRLRHPVYGNRDRWVTQPVKPGWFTDPIEKRKDQLAADISKVMDRIARKVEG